MQYKVLIKHKALNDLAQINEWYAARRGEEAAEKVCAGIKAALQRLEAFPQLGTITPDSELNSLGWRKYVHRQYVILYKTENQLIEVHRIIDERREDYIKLLREGGED